MPLILQIFTKLAITQCHCMDMFCTEFYPNQPSIVEIMHTSSSTPQVKYDCHQVEFRETRA
jgi:hypothetical protein